MSTLQQVEATSKSIKAVQLIGVLVVLGSGATAVFYRHDVGLHGGLIGAGVGAGIWVVGRFLAWWRHG